MAKKRKQQQQNPAAPAVPAVPAVPGQPVPAQPAQTSLVSPEPAAASAEPAVAPVSNTQIMVFWSAVVLTVVLAWVLDYMLPGVSERVIERWIMLGFAVFLGLFLYKL